jgi:hypothetical protein
MTLILPSIVMLVNDDLTSQVQGRIVQQLFVSEVIDLPEYQARLAGTPEYYPTIIRQNNIRLMVVASYFGIGDVRPFDIGIFVKDGQCNVDFVHEYNHCWCDGYNRVPDGYTPCCHWDFSHRRLSVPVDRMYWHEILKGTLPDHLFRGNPCVQNNILFPLDCKVCKPLAAPFGTSCNKPIECLPNPFNLPITCICRE